MSRSFRYAVVASTLSEEVRTAPGLARRAGFAGVQFDAFGPVNLPELSATGRREFRHMVSSQDQQIAGLRVDIGAKGFAPGADADRALDRIERAMDAAATLMAGAEPLICVDAGPMPTPEASQAPKPKVRPEEAGIIILPTADMLPADLRTAHQTQTRPFDSAAATQIDSAMYELGRRADRYNVTVTFRSELASLAALERTLAAARCPWFGVDLDPVALLRDEWSIDEFFARLGTQVRHVRGRDAQGGAEGRTKSATIGQGSTNWEELLATLGELGYAGWITIDPTELTNRSGSAVAGLEHLKRMG